MVLTRCPIQNGTELWTPGDEYNKSPSREGVPNCSVRLVFSNLGLPSLQNLLYPSPGVQSSVPFWIGHLVSTTLSGRHFSRLTYKFYGVWWLRVATWRCFSGFMVREIPIPRTWRVYLATGFDFRGKNRACFGSIGVPTLASVSYLVTILWRKVNGDHFPETSCTY